MGVQFSQLPIASSVAADDYLAVLDVSDNLLKRMPVEHSSTTTTYGVGTTSAYGHNKVIDDLSKNTSSSGESLSAHQGNVLGNDMGQVETTSTASYAHVVGEYFIFIGQFVRCTSAISVGETIAIGTNVASTSIGAVLKDVNDRLGTTDISSVGSTITGAISTLNSNLTVTYTFLNTSYGNIHIYKYGKVVRIYASLNDLDTTKSEIKLVIVPSGYASPINYAVGIFYDGTNPFVPIGSVWLGLTGNLNLYKPTNSSSGYIDIEYIIV